MVRQDEVIPGKRRSLRVAITSDLHAYDEVADTSSPPSHLRIGLSEDQPTKHPISGLLKLVEAEHLQAEVLLCAGDLGDKARPIATSYAWSAIHKIGVKLRVSCVVGTAGNHDVDSRYLYNGHDPKGVLQGLVPAFPLADESLCDKYWSRNFAVLNDSDYRVVTLNTSAFHGGSADEERHGRISDHTLATLKQALGTTTPPPPVNILLCHHHPQQHMELNLADYDVMKQGQLLLDLLGTGSYGEWLVVHGHKHHPKVTYAAGGACAPVIFSAGSLCANLYLELQSRARNQFYLVDLPLARMGELGLVGRFSAWEWSSGVGWIPAGGTSGLPHKGGFGYRGKPQPLAGKIITLLGGNENPAWNEIATLVPEIEFLLPTDLSSLLSILEGRGVRVLPDEGSMVVPDRR